MYIQSLQPTTVSSSSYLNVVADKTGKLTLKVLDVQGRIAKKLSTAIAQGTQQLSVNLDDLTSGIYILNAFNGDVFIKSFRFTKD